MLKMTAVKQCKAKSRIHLRNFHIPSKRQQVQLVSNIATRTWTEPLGAFLLPNNNSILGCLHIAHTIKLFDRIVSCKLSCSPRNPSTDLTGQNLAMTPVYCVRYASSISIPALRNVGHLTNETSSSLLYKCRRNTCLLNDTSACTRFWFILSWVFAEWLVAGLLNS